MQLVEFTATEYVSGEVELDLDTKLTEEDAKEMALREIRLMYPEYDDIQVLVVKDI